jgi:hypothetical protein
LSSLAFASGSEEPENAFDPTRLSTDPVDPIAPTDPTEETVGEETTAIGEVAFQVRVSSVHPSGDAPPVTTATTVVCETPPIRARSNRAP